MDELIQRAGSQAALAKALGVTQQAVSLWRQMGYIPDDERALKASEAFDVHVLTICAPTRRALLEAASK
jgi:transcriptional regulator with XRE-family HTH domain